MKSLLTQPIIRTIIAWLFYAYLRLVYATNKATIKNQDTLDFLFASGKPLILVFWHGRMCFMPFLARRPKNIHAMISHHDDGALIARVKDFFHLRYVRGSSNRPASHPKGAKDRGGSNVLRESVNLLQSGKHIAITPDGPKGPRMRLQPGLLQLAEKTGATIVPITFSTTRGKIFHSWDRFLLPLPFGKALAVIGDPVTIPPKSDETSMKTTGKTIENQLNTMTREADKWAGLPPVDPAHVT